MKKRSSFVLSPSILRFRVECKAKLHLPFISHGKRVPSGRVFPTFTLDYPKSVIRVYPKLPKIILICGIFFVFLETQVARLD